MTAQTVMTLLMTGGGIAAVVWVLHKIGKALTAIVEALATLAVVFLAVWLAVKGTFLVIRWAVVHWRTTLGLTVVGAWVWWWSWLPVVLVVAAGAVGLVVWRWRHRSSFETWAGRRLRSWWLRWAVYAPKLPTWLRNCGLTIRDHDRPIVLTANPLGRSKVQRKAKPRKDQEPRVLGVRSGASWDEVRVRLVPGQKPEDFDDAARALAVARGVARCQVRELKPRVVSIDFQRRNLLEDTVWCRELADLADVPGSEIDLKRVWSGRTDYGTDWHQSLQGSHTLHAGVTGAGKGAQMWCPLVSIAPAIRDGLVRLSGIDPKGMELAYGRRIFHRYAVTGKDALALLDDLIEGADKRKAEFAGRLRTVPISRENPLEIVEFDEIGALIRYIGDRKLREAITERVALLTTQGRALGYTVRGYVQEPTKDTVPVRELSPAASACGWPRSRTSGWCSATRRTTGARGRTASASPSPASATCSAKASANRFACGVAGSPTKRSRTWRRSSPATPRRVGLGRCMPSPTPRAGARAPLAAWHEHLLPKGFSLS